MDKERLIDLFWHYRHQLKSPNNFAKIIRISFNFQNNILATLTFQDLKRLKHLIHPENL